MFKFVGLRYAAADDDDDSDNCAFDGVYCVLNCVIRTNNCARSYKYKSLNGTFINTTDTCAHRAGHSTHKLPRAQRSIYNCDVSMPGDRSITALDASGWHRVGYNNSGIQHQRSVRPGNPATHFCAPPNGRKIGGSGLKTNTVHPHSQHVHTYMCKTPEHGTVGNLSFPLRIHTNTHPHTCTRFHTKTHFNMGIIIFTRLRCVLVPFSTSRTRRPRRRPSAATRLARHMMMKHARPARARRQTDERHDAAHENAIVKFGK